jgi:hypothetical protein
MRTILAAILGGVVVFAWGFVSHVVLGLHDKSIHPVAGEQVLMDAVKGAARTPGVYVFPYISSEQMKDTNLKTAHTKKYSDGPNGLLVIGENGQEPMGTDRLIKQLASSVIAAFLAAMLIGGLGAGAGLLTKTLAGAALGAFAWASQLIPFWIWYGFTQDWEIAYLIDGAVAWGAAGLVMSFVLVKPKKPAPK